MKDWPLPASWRESVVSTVVAHAREREIAKQEKKKKSGSQTPNREIDPLHEFQQHTLREKYYQIIGHHHVLDLCRIAFANEDEIENRLDRFIKELGINPTQRERWIAEKTFIEADNFFAYSLLIMARKVGTLPLCDNDVIVGKSVVSILHYLAKTYDHAVPLRLDHPTLLFVIALMTEMMRSPDSVFNPHDKGRGTQNARGLMRLVDTFLPAIENEDMKKYEVRHTQMEKTIRRTLTDWGLAYGLFIFGRRQNWREGGLI